MLRMKKITDMYDTQVYVETGELFGVVEESIITTNKVYGWRIKATKNSILNRILGGAKGVIVPHQFVKSVGDVMIISKSAVPSYEESKEEEEATE